MVEEVDEQREVVRGEARKSRPGEGRSERGGGERDVGRGWRRTAVTGRTTVGVRLTGLGVDVKD